MREVLRKLNSALLDLPSANSRSTVEEGLHNLQLLTDTVLSTEDAAELGEIFCYSVARYWNNEACGKQKNSVQLYSIKALDFYSSLTPEALIVALMPHRNLLTSESEERDSKSCKNPWKS